jgi:hypothetical protein
MHKVVTKPAQAEGTAATSRPVRDTEPTGKGGAVADSPRVQQHHSVSTMINNSPRMAVQRQHAGAIVQRKPVEMVATGLTHMVREMDGSLYRKNFLENEAEEVVDGDSVEIETTSRIQSERGPNQEEHAATDEDGPAWYGWYKASKLKGQPVKAPDKTYIREDTIEAKGTYNTATVDTAEKELSDARGEQGRSINSPVVPKDLSNQPKNAHMSFDHDGELAGRQASAGYIEKMAKVGAARGFKVHVTCSKEGAGMLKGMIDDDAVFGLLTIVEVAKKMVETWSEDSGNFNVMGGVSVPARIPKEDIVGHKINAFFARALRYYPREEVDPVKQEISLLAPDAQETAIRKAFPKIDFSLVGRVAKDDNVITKAALATGGSRPLREDMTHQEGGNTLTGTLVNGAPYAVVGRDSAEFSRSILQKRFGKPVNGTDLRAFLGADLGIDKDAIFLVEQPGEFHLDMAMVLMGPEQVAINDPIEAAKLAEEWAINAHIAEKPKAIPKPVKPQGERPTADPSDFFDLLGSGEESNSEWDDYDRHLKEYLEEGKKVKAWSENNEKLKPALAEMHKKSEHENEHIERAILDLKAAKLKVSKLPLVFTIPGFLNMNFANGEGGTDIHGKRFFVTNGGEAEARRYISDMLGKLYDVEVEFVDEASSKKSLDRSGGAGCRVKFEGTPKL